MKKSFLYIIFAINILLLVFVIGGCSTKKNDENNNTPTVSTHETVLSTTLSTIVDDITTTSADVVPEISYTQAENELEIITVPSVQNESPKDEIQDNTEGSTQIATEPQNPFESDEEIELPIIPVA